MFKRSSRSLLPLFAVALSVHSTALGESTAVPYPAPLRWSHAWPYDVMNAVALSPNITVKSEKSGKSEGSEGDLIAVILARYQTLLRNKASASAKTRGSAISNLPVLSHIDAKVTSTGPEAFYLGPKTDESYQVNVKLAGESAIASVFAATAFGLKHGLESLAQLVKTPEGYIAGVNASTPLVLDDRPAWPYRALMIDTGRHYLSLDTIKHAIDGMAALKLNVLHWHLLDSSSFPVQSEKFPQLSSKGSYSAAAVYSLDELKSVVEYARSRAVRVVPEIEMPGHGSFSAGMPELSLPSCSDVLDVTKNSTYAFLVEFLLEISTAFTDELLMLGGDEVGFDPKCTWPGVTKCGYHCFDRDPAVASWMQARGLNATQTLADYFWEQVTAQVVPKLNNKTVGVWIADTPNGASSTWPAPHMSTLPKGAVANVYQSMRTAVPILDAGYPVVLSVAGSSWYLDYHPTFATVYDVRPCDKDQLDCDHHLHRRANLLGGSVSQWGEKVDQFNFDSNVWTGASALAERLWTDLPTRAAGTGSAKDAEERHHNLQCHWAMWGISTYTREKSGSENVAASDASLSDVCPADWTSPPV